MNAILLREAPRRHRAVKHHLAKVRQPREQPRGVAVADENLRIGADQLGVKMRQQVVAAVAAAGAQNGAHLGTREHLMQLADAPLHRAREVKILVENGRQVKRLVAEFAQTPATSLDRIALNCARRRNDADGIAITERRRFSCRVVLPDDHGLMLNENLKRKTRRDRPAAPNPKDTAHGSNPRCPNRSIRQSGCRRVRALPAAFPIP